MTSPQGRMRPQHPAEHRVVDLLTTFALDARGGDIVPGLSLTGVSVASGDVQPGDVFIALDGMRAHGATYTAQALAGGAVAVLTDERGAQIIADEPTAAGAPVLVAEDPRALAGPVAAWAHDH